MDDIIKEFLVESYENLDKLDQYFVALEKQPNDKETLSSIFRVIHTIKGTCGFLGFNYLEKLTHVGESLLSKLRDGHLALTPEMTSTLLTMIDAIRTILATIEETKTDGQEAYLELIDELTRLQTLPNTTNSLEASPNKAEAELSASSVSSTTTDIQPEKVAEIIPPENDTLKEELSSIENNASKKGKLDQTPISESSIRVDVSLLDRLMNLVGELVLSRNQILQFTAKQTEASFLATSQRLNLITSELQEGVMKTRMQPIYNIWNKFPRIVRDLAYSLKKKVEVVMEGKETEIDRSIIEAIKDPLTHLVRNTVDHGIEFPEVRKNRGKAEVGTLLLRAYHEGGQVNIEISDDGNGIDLEKVKQKALEKNLISPESLAKLTDKEIVNLIFLPGFSTAEKVTNVSGRGVGMDVVKTNIEKIGGIIDIQNQHGYGTTIKIKIPLTLAIIPALIVTTAEDRYAIPQVSLVELVRLEVEQAQNSIELIQGIPFYRLRENLLPLVYLNEEFGFKKKLDDGVYPENDAINIVVLQAEGNQFGLIVDQINDTQEIVVKPLSKLLKGVSAFAGATIMGDGKVALILDIMGLAQKASIIAAINEREERSRLQKLSNEEHTKQTLLLLKSNEKGLLAIPLNVVARLEEFSKNSIEFVGNNEVVQYRGKVMPLIRVSQVLHGSSAYASSEINTESSELIQVVVYSEGDKNVGLVVEKILDIIEDSIIMQEELTRPGTLCSAIIQGKVTEILDMKGILQTALPQYFANSTSL